MQHHAKSRYARNIALADIGIEGQKQLNKAKIIVAGAGGLGSVVLTNLTCIGIGEIGIIDCDNIEITNLNRQFIHSYSKIGQEKVLSAKKWITEYNPETTVNTYSQRFDENNYKNIINQYDIVIDCFDSFESKLNLNKTCFETSKTLIHAGVQENIGQLTTIIPQKTCCLQCFIDSQNKTEVPKGILSPIVSIIGSLQASEAVKIILKKDNILFNKLLSYNIDSNRQVLINLKKNSTCPLCSKS